MGQILIKLGENVGTLGRLIVVKFHKNRFSFDIVMMSFLFFKVISKGRDSAQREKLCAKGNDYTAPDCDTSNSDLLVCIFLQWINKFITDIFLPCVFCLKFSDLDLWS